MKKKHNKKKQQVVSDVSNDNTLDGTTTLQGFTAWGRTHPGGIFTGTFSTQRSLSPLVTGHPATSQPVTGHPLTEQEFIMGQPVTCQLVTSQPTGQSVTCQPVTGQINTSQPITCHQSSSHRSLEIDYQTPGISQLSLVNQSLVINQIIRLQFVALMLLALSTQQITN